MNIVFNENWKASEVHSSKGFAADSYFVSIKLINGSDVRIFEFTGSRDIESLMDIYESSRIEISKDPELQNEFGRYKLCLTADGYTEIYFDKCLEKT